MKVTLEFTEEDGDHAKYAVNGHGLWSALWDVDGLCRDRLKHAEDVSDAEYVFLERIREVCNLAHMVEDM